MNSKYEALNILEIDHIEFAVKDLDKAAELYLRMGFEKALVRKISSRQLQSHLFVQNDIRVILSHSKLPSDPVYRFAETHGDGVISVGFLCEDTISTFQTALNRGALALEEPKTNRKEFGTVTEASIKAFGDIQHRFISRKGSLFLEGFEDPLKASNRGIGLLKIDHITSNLEKGKLDEWASYYEKVFGLKNTRFFDIKTQRTGLYSKVMQSPNGIIKMPFNEPTDPKSQIQEFIDVLHGPGIQHIALLTENILETLPSLKAQSIQFLETPSTYYEMLPNRLPNVTEPLAELEKLQIQVDGDNKGYLLQIFTQPVVGPFFYEIIQRKNHDGFGEGNFRALFEAIERDQIRRGVL